MREDETEDGGGEEEWQISTRALRRVSRSQPQTREAAGIWPADDAEAASAGRPLDQDQEMDEGRSIAHEYLPQVIVGAGNCVQLVFNLAVVLVVALTIKVQRDGERRVVEYCTRSTLMSGKTPAILRDAILAAACIVR
ncbi:hypothetical protein AURDEDRAFT_174763 [Auricularia subglabra TFB-10046 SS5]|uniref:Uncharacterized protein n=1 Tax=Auricularia subglabra (strain TFB-10046 / SS5) TaxID=717982 RepID=J0LFL2_AURST|nr:hypothetical protein AURDEDRAFT_174763 [Auricularia subglabra TFB-10046 SS5]